MSSPSNASEAAKPAPSRPFPQLSNALVADAAPLPSSSPAVASVRTPSASATTAASVPASSLSSLSNPSSRVVSRSASPAFGSSLHAVTHASSGSSSLPASAMFRSSMSEVAPTPSSSVVDMSAVLASIAGLASQVRELSLQSKHDRVQDRVFLVKYVSQQLGQSAASAANPARASPVPSSSSAAPAKQQARAASSHAAAQLASRAKLGASVDQLSSINQFMSANEAEFESDYDVDLSDPTLGENEQEVNEHKQTPAASAASTAQSAQAPAVPSPPPTSSGSLFPPLDPSLFPPRAGDRDSMLETVVKAITAKAKPTTSTTKIFKDRLSFDEVMNAQLKSILSSPPIDQTHIQHWMQYVAWLNRMIDEKGFDAADMYHRMLFARIADGIHSLFAPRGFYCDEIVRDVDRTYADIANPLGKGDNRFKSRYVSTHHSSSNSSNNGGQRSGKMQPKSGNSNSKSSGSSSSKQLHCSHHGQCAHTTADCSYLKRRSGSSEEKKDK
jgi:hypothetical protein